MSGMIRGITTCKLCGKEFAGPTHTIIGAPGGVNNQLAEYMKDIAQHFLQKHPQENEAVQYRSLEYMGMLRLMNFRTTDSELKKQVQLMRWQVAQQVIPIRLRDSKLSEMATQWGATLAESIMAKAAAVLPGKLVMQISPAALGELKASIQNELADKTVSIMRELRDLYEEPNKFNMTVVEVPKTDDEAPQTDLVIAP
jgi:hypothetical protein